MLIFKHMCVASDSRTVVVSLVPFVENEYEIDITVRSLGVSDTLIIIIIPYISVSTVHIAGRKMETVSTQRFVED